MIWKDYPNAPEGKHTFGDQLLWLERDLRKANKMRDQYPWIVVGGYVVHICSTIDIVLSTAHLLDLKKMEYSYN